MPELLQKETPIELPLPQVVNEAVSSFLGMALGCARNTFSGAYPGDNQNIL